MRKVLFLALCLIGSHASAQSPQGIVFTHECKQIDPQKTGFKCIFDRLGLKLVVIKDKKNMSAQEAETTSYHWNRIKVRYMELGGRHYDVHYAYLPGNKGLSCGLPKGKNFFICDKCTWVKEKGIGEICR